VMRWEVTVGGWSPRRQECVKKTNNLMSKFNVIASVMDLVTHLGQHATLS
jgi:hypothetical protein